MRKIRKQKWFAKATALLISALLLVTMLPQAVMAADSDPTDQANMTDVTIAEETNVEEAVNDAVDKATVSEGNAEETAAAEDAVTITGAESAESITGAESAASAGSGESDESGLTSIHIDDLTISEGAFRWNSQYSSIPYDTEVTIIYAGEEHKTKYGELSELVELLSGKWASPAFNSGETRDNQWEVGHTYPATVTLMDKTCTFNVTVAESPFIDLEAEDIEVIEGVGGYDRYDSGGWFCYQYSPVVTLTTKTGEKIKPEIDSLIGQFTYNGEVFYLHTGDDQYNNHWGIGQHTATVSLSDLLTDEFIVNVVETPIAKIEFNPSVISDYGYDFDSADYLLNYTIYFKDGTSVDVTGRDIDYKGKSYRMEFEYLEEKEDETKTARIYTYVASILGKEATIDMKYPFMDSIELIEEDGLKLRIKRPSGEIDEHKVYYMMSQQPLPYWQLYTDKGHFFIAYEYTGNYENMSISILEGGTPKQKSNQLKNSKWLQTALYTSDFNSLRYSMVSPMLESLTFDGKITADNIDTISALVFLSEPFQSPYDFVHRRDADGMYALIDADLMRSKIMERVAVNGDVDMSLSPSFDSSTNTIKVREDKIASGYSPDYLEVISTNKEQGFWVHSIENGYDAKFVFDDDYKIARINSDEPEPEFIKGDVNGDKAVDAKDLTTLAKHVAKIALITDTGLLKAADVNSDGTVDAKDLTHLAKYVAKIIPEL